MSAVIVYAAPVAVLVIGALIEAAMPRRKRR